MRRIALLFILISCVFAISTDVTYADVFTLKTWCNTVGNWEEEDIYGTCEMTQDGTIHADDTLIIAPNQSFWTGNPIGRMYTLDNYGTIEIYGLGGLVNAGTINNYDSGYIWNRPEGIINNDVGTLNNHGIIYNDNGSVNLMLNRGTINNYSYLKNGDDYDHKGVFYNDGGTINNYGTIDNWCISQLNNTGIINNYNYFSSCGEILNFGTIHNSDYLYNYNILRNFPDGTIINSGTIINNDTFENKGTIFQNMCRYNVINGFIIGSGVIIDLDNCGYLPVVARS